MNFTLFLRILYARRQILVATLLVVVAATLVVSFLLPKTYKATATLVINYKGVDPVTGVTLPAQMMPGYMPTQVDIIRSKAVAARVVDDLKLAEGEAIRQKFYEATEGKGSIRDWMASLIQKNLEVTPSRESSVLEIGYKGADPQFVAVLANAFAAAYQRTSIQLKVEPSRKAADFIDDQVKALRDKFEAAQNRLSKFQQEHGIVSATAQADGMDVETARLNELSAQLVVAQGQRIEAESRRNQAAGSGAGESPDVMNNSLVQSLKVSLATAEAKFAEIAQRLDVNHPQYKSAKVEVDKLRAELNAQIGVASGSVGQSAKIYRQREAELQAALAQQKAKVLEINRTRDELKILVNETENARRTYESAMQRYAQASLEGQANQADIAVLTPAVAPLSPSSPRIMLNALVSVFLGTMLGVGLAFVAELTNRRVRSGEDLGQYLKRPVLGVVDWKPQKHSRYRAFIQALLPTNLKTS